MIEKVNPSHPDKLADRIAGAIVDLAYTMEPDPRIAVEVLIGHGRCHVIMESSVRLDPRSITGIIHRIGGNVLTDVHLVPQDVNLARNQEFGLRCGDNVIFKGVPLTQEQKTLSGIARKIYAEYPSDGKYILDGERLIICQSGASTEALRAEYPHAEINPLGDWTGHQPEARLRYGGFRHRRRAPRQGPLQSRRIREYLRVPEGTAHRPACPAVLCHR